MANPEMMAKANEKRMSALEKRLETFEKDFRKSGDLSALAKRVSTLEAAVKALVTTAKGAGATDERVKGEIKQLKERVQLRDKEISDLSKSADPAAPKKIEALEKRKDTIEKTMLALGARADREEKRAAAKLEKIQKDHEKMVKEITEQNKKIIESSKLEARLNIIEAKVNSALGR